MPSIFEVIPEFRKKRVKLAIPRKVQDKIEVIELLEIDATIRETHNFNSEPTENPIEDGSVITDHVNIKPRELQLECVISNNPLSFRSALIGNAAGLVGGIVGRAAQSNIGAAVATGGLATIGNKLARTIVNDKNRVGSTIQKLQAAWEGASPLSVENALTVYRNMVITNMIFNRNVSTADSLFFNLTLREIRFVNSKLVRVPKDTVQRAVENSATSQQDNGKQPTKPPTPEQASAWSTRKSAAKNIWEIIR
jgi:hypothetical protein